MALTESQRAAVESRGNVLVEAGAGGGKTSTLIARVLRFLEEPGASIDQVMMVTFTNAAAAEMRQRLAAKLMQLQRSNPGERRHAENLALMDAAHISTLHGFCLRLARENFYLLQLDPAIRALDEKEAALLAFETFSKVAARHYESPRSESLAILDLLQTQANSSENSLRKLVLRMHRHAQSLDDPQAWFERQRQTFSDSRPTAWREWLAAELPRWRDEWLATLSEYSGISQVEIAKSAFACLQGNFGLADLRQCLDQLAALKQAWKGRGKNTAIRDEIIDLFKEAEFLASYCPTDEEADPLQTDWDIARPQMAALINLTEEFGREYNRAKRDLGSLDFSDLEQCALRLLWDFKANAPSALAQAWRERLALILVDEYQDINAAQDKIISAISREGAGRNRFLVGDVKQSIYRFRLADPSIFRAYLHAWRGTEGSNVRPLSENFRSHEQILEFVNHVFQALMHPAFGGIRYDKHASLRFGAPDQRQPLSRNASKDAVELLLHAESTDEERVQRGLPSIEEDDRTESELEAAMIAQRLKELHEDESFKIYDPSLPEEHRWRRMQWGDAAILLRALSKKAPDYVKQFARAGIPLDARGAGFYEAQEVRDLRSVLSILDNPLQDIPLLAALRSPFGGFGAEDLALIRCAGRVGPFWGAVQQFHARSLTFQKSLESEEVRARVPALQAKVAAFLQRYEEWRRFAGQSSIYGTLQRISEDAGYELWLRSQPRPEQKLANVRRLLQLAQGFDRSPEAGIFRFLRAIEAEAEADLDEESASAPQSKGAVQLMTIHASKGLEFPVVVLADTDNGFNFQDLREGLLFDPQHGPCPRIAAGEGERSYPSIALWLARRAEKPELIGEELRLLYVAMTRAEQKLILSGCTTARKLEEWKAEARRISHPRGVAAARSYLGWIAPLMESLASDPGWDLRSVGRSNLLDWRILHDVPRLPPPDRPQNGARVELSQALLDRLSWKYPRISATTQSAKASVSRLREQLPEPVLELSHGRGNRSAAEAAAFGSTHHTLLQHAILDELKSAEGVRAQAARLVAEGILGQEDASAVDAEGLASFWRSEIGLQILARSGSVHRELPFTARFDAEELTAEHGLGVEGLSGEFLVIQGVADLAVILPEEIWILDFKTEQLTLAELQERTAHHQLQLSLYARALERSYKRPVTRLWIHFLAVRQTVSFPLARETRALRPI